MKFLALFASLVILFMSSAAFAQDAAEVIPEQAVPEEPAADVPVNPENVSGDNWREWPMGDRLKLSVGVYMPDLDTNGSIADLDSPLPATDIDFEDDLDLDDDDSTVYASLAWRFLKRNKLTFNYYGIDRDATTMLDETISFDGEIFPVNSEVSSFSDVDVYEVAYSFSLIFTERMNLELGFGVSTQDYEAGIQSPDVNGGESVDVDFLAPLPTLNLGFEYALGDNWILGVRGGWLDVDYDSGDDSIDGKILTGNAGVQWKIFDNLGVTAGYSYFHVDGEFEDDDSNYDVDIEYQGPQLTVDLFF
jgi:opacity protein-like surface antigen